jgi:2,3-bisphosphoglycerate-independent phosphoglycerate mutase
MNTRDLYYVTMTKYDNSFRNVRVVFEKDNVQMPLGEVLEKNGKSQVRIAETEKYPHVTFFFSGGREEPFEREKRIMVASPKVATYDLQPEMSAPEVTEAIIKEVQESNPDFVCLNFANADMVGHTGVFEAAIKAVETVDKSVEKVIACALKHNYFVLLTADHGNADMMINSDGSPNTAHTKNRVPLFLISNDKTYISIKNGKLGDISPTILKLMGIEIPNEMTGDVLV